LRDYKREERLYNKKIISDYDFEITLSKLALAKEKYETTQNQYNLLESGSYSSNISNIIKAPIKGTVIDLPLEEGASIIERNNFNIGSTIATIANTGQYIFKGKVNEIELPYLKQNMRIAIFINAYKNLEINATLKKIYPKGIKEHGITKYQFDAIFSINSDSVKIYSGFSAIARIIIENKDNVLIVEEKNIYYDSDSAFVDVVFNGKITKQHVKVGVSNGIETEIMDGIDENTTIINK
jgi:HlyD family secretion protein